MCWNFVIESLKLRTGNSQDCQLTMSEILDTEANMQF